MTLQTKDFNKVILKHAKNFTNVKEDHHNTKVTKYLHYLDDGSVFMTDAHKAVLVRKQHNEDAHTRSVAGKKMYADVYTSFGRLFPDDFSAEIEVSVKDLLNAAQAFEAIIPLVDDDLWVRIENKNGALEIGYSHVEVSGEWVINYNDQNDLQIYVSATYLVQIFKLLKDMKYETVTMKFNGKFRPLTFSSDDGLVDIILLPVRKN